MIDILIIIGSVATTLVSLYVLVRILMWLSDRKVRKQARRWHSRGPGIVAGGSYGEYGLGSTDVGGGDGCGGGD